MPSARAIRRKTSASWCRSRRAAASTPWRGSWATSCPSGSDSRCWSSTPGAGGNIGADVVAKSPPDGYTVLLTVNGLAISPALYRSLPFDPLKAFEPVTQVAASQFVLVGSPKLEAKTVQDVIALARAKPGKLNYGSSGIGAPLHLLAEMFKHGAGLDIAHIPYRGDAPMLTALWPATSQIAFMPLSTGVPQVQNGQVKGLAMTGRKRSKALPELPTLLGSRREGPGGRLLVRPVRAGGHAARHRRAAAKRNGRGAEVAGRDRADRASAATSRSAARRTSSTRSTRPTSPSSPRSSPTRKFRSWIDAGRCSLHPPRVVKREGCSADPSDSVEDG